MKVTRTGTPRAVLAHMAQQGKPVERAELWSAAKELAGSDHGGTVALLRLLEAHLIVLEYRMTPFGVEALRRANQ